MTWILILGGLAAFAWGLYGLLCPRPRLTRGRWASVALVGMIVFFVGVGFLAEASSVTRKQTAANPPQPVKPAKPTDVYSLASYLNTTLSLPPEAKVATQRGTLRLAFQAKDRANLEPSSRRWARDFFYGAYRSGTTGFNSAIFHLSDPDGQRYLVIEIGSKAAATIPDLMDPAKPMMEPDAFVVWVQTHQVPVSRMPDEWITFQGPATKGQP